MVTFDHKKMSISSSEFVEKYKLIPKNLRFQFLDFLSHFRQTIEENDEYDILDDLICVLMTYERTYHDMDNYLELSWVLHDNVCPMDHLVFRDVAESLLRQLRWFLKPVRVEDVTRFRHRQVMKDIEERVAYRPGNPGYERAKENFESLKYLYV